MIRNIAKSFDILETSLSILHNYFENPTKLIFRSNIAAKLLNTSAKVFYV